MASVGAHDGTWLLIRILYYASPPLILLYWTTAVAVSVCSLQTTSSKDGNTYVRRNVIRWLVALTIATYVGEGATILVQLLTGHIPGWRSDQAHNTYVLSSILAWVIQLLALSGSTSPVWYPYYGSWFITLIVEIILLALTSSFRQPRDSALYTKLGMQAARISILLLLPATRFSLRDTQIQRDNLDEENQALLGNSSIKNQSDPNYGTNTDGKANDTPNEFLEDSEDEEVTSRKAREKLNKRLERDGNWWTYGKGFLIFWPYIWPSTERSLQLCMILVGVCLLAGRVLNVLVPRQIGIIINALNISNGHVPYLEVALYAFYQLLNSSAGLDALRSYLWLPVEQYQYKAINTAAYNHIMQLSSDFHNSKSSGEMYTSVAQGHSVLGLLEMMLLDFLPMLTDLIIACIYFFYVFDVYMLLLIGAMIVLYFWSAAYFARRQTGMMRGYMGVVRKETDTMYDSIASWQTVSYFNRINFEQDKYSEAVGSHMRSQRTIRIGHWIMYGVQSSVLEIGFLIACFLAVYQVAQGLKPVGSFVTLLSYWAQLSGSLSFLTQAGRSILDDLIAAESLLELLQTKPTVVDRAGAKTLIVEKGEVEFESVSFSYNPRNPTLKDINLRVAPGQTVALVGETGGGKSTILKLLFRFYDVSGGSIKIDGQDVKAVALSSLRDNIGVVPQDPTLFNQSIMTNIRYAKLDATDEDVFEACKAAAIHEKILSFPNGYSTKVGERGVKLSGGELQRVSIARAILKNPRIILLDEATSMIDTETEGKIQEAFKKLTEDRTTFVVAHRLSTIVNADLILVVKSGEIVEQGTHDQLNRLKGRYHDLWTKQISIGLTRKTTETKVVEDASGIFHDLGSDIRLNDPVSTNTMSDRRDGGEGKSQGLQGMVENFEKQAQDDKEVKRDGKPAKSMLNVWKEKIWKPDAPEFIPSHLRRTPSDNVSQRESSGEQQQEQISASKDTWIQRKGRQRRNAEVKKREKVGTKASDKENKEQGEGAKATAKQQSIGVEGMETISNNGGENVQTNRPPSTVSELPDGSGTSKVIPGSEKAPKRPFRNRLSRDKNKKRNGPEVQNKDLSTSDQPAKSGASPDGPPDDKKGAATSSGNKPLDEAGHGGEPMYKKSRFDRRAMSKSKPHLQDRDQLVRTGDNGFTSGSVEHQPMKRSRRRVSVPSDPAIGHATTKGLAHSHGRRSHSRNKNRSETTPGSAEDTSSSWYDSPTLDTPPAPAASPTGESDREGNHAQALSEGLVRFAPGF
ncbi:MAG: hypothetical protein M1827_002789 [Pycnora praestabilis]|nr:MAG: hypothetical protein M1827_002789 [Pycnora praestabilis]